MIGRFLYLSSLLRVIERQTQHFHVLKRGLIITFYITNLLFVLKENIYTTHLIVMMNENENENVILRNLMYLR